MEFLFTEFFFYRVFRRWVERPTFRVEIRLIRELISALNVFDIFFFEISFHRRSWFLPSFFFYRVFRNRLRLRLKIPFKTGAAFICFVFQLYRVFLFFFFLPSFAESFVDRVPLNWISFDSVSLLTRSSFNCELRNELLINYDQFTGFLPSFRGFLGFL